MVRHREIISIVIRHLTKVFNKSINPASKNYFDRVFRECFLAANLRATYLTDNAFKSRLVSKNFSVDKSIQDFTANQIVNVELPFLDELDTDKLMSIRSNDSSVFQNFRLELEKHCRELRSISDSKLIDQKMQNIFHELNDVQGRKIQQKISSLHRQMKLSTAIGLAGLATSFVTGGLTLLATATAIGKGFKDYLALRIRFKKIRLTFFGKARSNPDDPLLVRHL